MHHHQIPEHKQNRAKFNAFFFFLINKDDINVEKLKTGGYIDALIADIFKPSRGETKYYYLIS